MEGDSVGRIGPGLLVLVAVTHPDTSADAAAIAEKLVDLRIFADERDAMNRSVQEAGGEILVVSQFTLYGSTRRGRRPSFTAAAPPEMAAGLIQEVVERIQRRGIGCETGVFGARMEVESTNDGPVTLILETRDGRLV